jgi:hypothetical protein
MMSAYYLKDQYGQKQLRESYKYELDSMGKYPVRQVLYYNDFSGNIDSNVAVFKYRNAN